MIDDLTYGAILSGSQSGPAPTGGGSCYCECDCWCLCFCFPFGYMSPNNWSGPANNKFNDLLGSNFGKDYVS